MLASFHTNQCKHYYTLKNFLLQGTMALNAFIHTWTHQVSMFPPHAIVPLVLSYFLAEHVTGQFRLLILVIPCWMEFITYLKTFLHGVLL